MTVEEWLAGPLRLAYPYESVVLTHGEISLDRVTISHCASVGYDGDFLLSISQPFDVPLRGVIKQFIKARLPIFIDCSAPPSWVTDFERKEMMQIGSRNVAAYGLVNLKSDAGCYLSFSNVTSAPESVHLKMLEFIAPFVCNEFIHEISRAEPRKNSIIASLTPRQLEVARLVASGLSNKSIARVLNISEKTVKNQLTRAYASVGAKGRLDLATKRRF